MIACSDWADTIGFLGFLFIIIGVFPLLVFIIAKYDR